MSAQPYSRADRNRIRAAFRAGRDGVIVVAVNKGAGALTLASEAHLCARRRDGRPVPQPAPRIEPPTRLDSMVHLCDEFEKRNFHAPRLFVRDEYGNVAVVDLGTEAG